MRLANRGNVTEKLAGRVTIAVGGRSACASERRGASCFPGRLGVLAAVYRGTARGLVRVRVGVRGAGLANVPDPSLSRGGYRPGRRSAAAQPRYPGGTVSVGEKL